MVPHAVAEHRVVKHIERSEQGSGAVANIVVGHGAGLIRLERQPQLGVIERLYLGLFVDREHDSVARWRQVETDDVSKLVYGLEVARAIEHTQAMRLQVVGGLNPLHRPQGQANGLGHHLTRAVMRRLTRWLAAGQCHYARHKGLGRRRLSGFLVR